MNLKTLSFSLGLPTALLCGSLAVGGSMAGFAAGARAPQMADLSTQLAVVDYNRVRRNYPRAKKLLEDRHAETAETQRSIDEETKALEKLAAEMEGLQPFTQARIAAQSRWAAARAQLEQRVKLEDERLKRDRARIRQQCFLDIERAITELAKKKGIQLVLRLRHVPEEALLSDKLIQQDLGDVLYSSPKLDLTDAVIKFLTGSAGESSQPGNGK